MKKKVFLWVVVGLVALALLIQLIPLPGRGNNPAVVAEPNWDSSQTRALVIRACFDCHSNETVWPWYSYVAPVSWLVYGDVMEGRSRMNFSDWNRSHPDLDEIINALRENDMPPVTYRLIHPSARLLEKDKVQLVTGLSNSLP